MQSLQICRLTSKLDKLTSNNTPKFNFRTYFLKGTDPRFLSRNQQQTFIENFLSHDNAKSNAFFVYNSYEALRKLNTWKQKLSWISPFYAVKANPLQPLLKDFLANDCGFDVASKNEIKMGLDLGLDPKKMVFSNSVKEESHIKYARDHNVLLTTADTVHELKKIQAIAPEMKVLWRISITEDNPEKLATTFSGKFGDDITSKAQAYERFKQLAGYGVKLQGIHFHCGSGQNGASNFETAIDMARFCIKIGREFGHKMETLDLGGGYPAGDLSEPLIQALSKTYNDPLGYEVMAEPGRHFSSSSCHLAMRVIGKRTKNEKTCYHVNESLYHSFNCNIMDGVSFNNQKDQVFGVKEVNKNEIVSNNVNQLNSEECQVFGMTCDGMDQIAKNISLPKGIQVDDWIVMGGMGSYTYGPRSKFNGMESCDRIESWSQALQERISNEEEVNESEYGKKEFAINTQ